MTTDSGDASTSRAVNGSESGSAPGDTDSGMTSPYDIGLAADEDETGPKPLDTELEDQQVQGEA